MFVDNNFSLNAPDSMTILNKIHPDVRELLKEEGVWLAGGALRDIVSGYKEPADYDIFFKEYKDEEKDLFGDTYKSLHDKGYRKTQSSFDGTLVSLYKKETDVKVQLIGYRSYKDIQDVIENFNFTINQIITDGKNILYGTNTLWDIQDKKLEMVKLRNPKMFMKKLAKYHQYGYTMSNECIEFFLTSIAIGNYTSDPQFEDYDVE